MQLLKEIAPRISRVGTLFDPATAYIGVDWQADEAADPLIREGKIPSLLLVGIDNAQKDRPREYLPYRSFNPPIMRPQGKRYPDFLLNEVMPFLYQRYRIARGPENTGLGGSSLGAVISLYTVMSRPGPDLAVVDAGLKASSVDSGAGS